MPAETFVRICKCIARPNFVSPRLREAAGTLGASKYTSFVFLKILGFCDAYF